MAELKLEVPTELKSKVGSILLGKLLIRLIKQDIFERYKQIGEITVEDQEFCDKIDWHPVDWLPLREEYVKKLKKIEKGPHSRMTLEELDKLMGLE